MCAPEGALSRLLGFSRFYWVLVVVCVVRVEKVEGGGRRVHARYEGRGSLAIRSRRRRGMRREEGLSANVLGNNMGVRISKTLYRYRTHLFPPVTARCISATIGRMHYPALRPDLGQGDWKGFHLRVPRVVCREFANSQQLRHSGRPPM